MKKPYSFVASVVSSRKFFWFVIALFILQALWIALSFRYPLVYDESFHFPVIQIFSHQLSPFITNQPHAYDTFGDLGHSNSVLYHYIMSFPYRFIALFTNQEFYQVIFLRALNIVMSAAGLVVFARLFRKINISQTYINAGILVFTLLPIVPFVAAHISYDNMLFLLTALYLLFAARVIQISKIKWQDYVGLISLGCFATLVKITFLPIFAASVVYLAVLIIRRHGKKFFSRLFKSIKQARKKTLALGVAVLIVFAGLFSATYLRNIVVYGTPQPKCVQTLSKQRCLTGRMGYLIKRSHNALATKSQRPTVTLPRFTQKWFNNMLIGTELTAANTYPNDKLTSARALPILNSLLFFGVFLGVGLLLYAWRSLHKNQGWYFLLTMTATLFLTVCLFNANTYYSVHAFLAEQPRYLLSLVPVLAVMMAASAAYALRKHNWLKLLTFAVLILLLTQGGGLITHILRSKDSWYWQKPKVIKANHIAKKILQPIVKEH